MKTAEKLEARLLRSQGFSIKEICQRLTVAKSSVSLWVRDIELTPEQIAKLEERIVSSQQRFSYLSRCGGANRNRADAEQRHALFQRAGYEAAENDESFRLICALYWGEGHKRNRTFAVCNSDPTLLNFILNWLVHQGFDDAIRFSVRFHPTNGLSEAVIRAWWMARLPRLRNSHLRRFGRCHINRASQCKHIGRLPYGTAMIEVCRVELYFKVLGGIDYLRALGDW